KGHDIGVENKAGAGQAGFRLLQFRDIQGRYRKPPGLKTSSGAGKRSWKNHRAADAESIGSVRLGRIDVEPIEAGEGSSVEPSAIGEQDVSADVGNGGFEMQAAVHRHGNHLVVVRREDARELANAFGVGAASLADEDAAVDLKDIAALDRAG